MKTFVILIIILILAVEIVINYNFGNQENRQGSFDPEDESISSRIINDPGFSSNVVGNSLSDMKNEILQMETWTNLFNTMSSSLPSTFSKRTRQNSSNSQLIEKQKQFKKKLLKHLFRIQHNNLKFPENSYNHPGGIERGGYAAMDQIVTSTRPNLQNFDPKVSSSFLESNGYYDKSSMTQMNPSLEELVKFYEENDEASTSKNEIYRIPSKKQYQYLGHEDSPTGRPKLHGSYGQYSWTIEKATPQMLENEGLLQPETIYKAILEVEQLGSNQNNQKTYKIPPETGDFLYNLGNTHSKTGEVHKQLFDPAHPQPFSSSNVYHGSYFHDPSYSTDHTYESPYSDYKDGSGTYSSSHSSELATSYGSTKWDMFDDLIAKSKNIFEYFTKAAHVDTKPTRKILEVSIALLPFLAFVGYITAIIFQYILPSISLPIIPGLLNVNITRPGVFHFVIGRDFKDSSEAFFDEALERIRRKVEDAIAERSQLYFNEYF